MADGDAAEATLAAYADAQGRLEHAGGYRWRDGVDAALRGLGFDATELDRPLCELLRRRADPGVAGAGDRLAARPAAARRAHQPPRHLGAGMARGLPRRARRGGRPRRPRPLVPGVGRHLGARARGRPGTLLRRGLARLARRAGRPRARRGARHRPARGRDRAHAALRRAVSLQGDEGAPGAVEAEGDRAAAKRHGRDRPAKDARTISFSFGRPSAAAGSCSSSTDARLEVPGRTLVAHGRDVARARRACLPGRRQRLGQIDPGPGTGRRARSRRWQARRGHNVKLAYLAQHTELRRCEAATVLAHAQHATGLSEAKTRGCSGASCSAATR